MGLNCLSTTWCSHASVRHTFWNDTWSLESGLFVGSKTGAFWNLVSAATWDVWFEFRQGRDVELSRQATWWPRGPHTDPRQNAKLVFALCRTAFLQMRTKARTGHSPFLETHLQGRRGDPCQLEAGAYFSQFFEKVKICTRRWWQSLTRLRSCGHLLPDSSCGPRSFRRPSCRFCILIWVEQFWTA